MRCDGIKECLVGDDEVCDGITDCLEGDDEVVVA